MATEEFSRDDSTNKGTSLTCISCKVLFTTPKDQKEHYKSDLHRFNLKRKVTNLPPVTKEQFEQKLQAMQTQEEDEKRAAEQALTCKICDKAYNSENQIAQHLKSKKHLDRVASGVSKPKPKSTPREPIPEEQRPKLESLTIFPSAEISQLSPEEREALNHKLSTSRILTPEECIFCCLKSSNFETNVQHMTIEHGLFIPDIEYLIDCRGLIKYLAEKVSVGNVCLWCNSKGKSFNTMEAAQQHMITKSHCKIWYAENGDEFDAFYDFSKDGENKEEELDVASTVRVSEDGHQLIFENGKVVGHRSLAIFYKQKFRPEPRDALLVNQLMSQYRQIGWHTDSSTFSQLDKKDHRQHFDMNLKLGVKKNNQKFHRDQNYED